MIQRALAPRGAKVTESAMVDVPGISDGREIDILIETAVGPYHIKIAVEAKDEGRKMDSTKFESILGKYNIEGGVRVNKVVVITHQGFYQPVIDRAKLLGVDLYTLQQAQDVDWEVLFPQQLQFRLPPHLCGIELEPQLDPQILQDVLKEGEIVCSHGTNHGTPPQFAMSHGIRGILMQRPTFFADLEQTAAGPTGQAKADVTFTPDHTHVIRFRGRDYPLTSLKFRIHMISAVGQMTYSMCHLTSTDGKTTELPLGEVQVGGKRIRLLMPEGMKSPQIILRIDSA
jgi:hypothetical protein